MVNIIVPIYNGGKTLERCLTSIVNQEDVSLKVFLVVQKSSDDSFDICEKYRKKYNFFTVLTTDGGSGVSHNRNIALNYIKEGFVMFIDCDDEFSSSKSISNLLMYNEHYDLICGNRLLISNNNKYIVNDYYHSDFSVKTKEVFNNSFIKNHIFDSTQAKLYKNNIISEHNLRFCEDLNIGEDNVFNYSYFKLINSLYITKEIIVNDYTNNEESLSRKYNKNNDLQFIKIYQYSNFKEDKYDYIVWEETFWNILSLYQKIKQKESIFFVYKKIWYFYHHFWIKSPYKYRARLFTKRKYLLNLHFLLFFCITL